MALTFETAIDTFSESFISCSVFQFIPGSINLG